MASIRQGGVYRGTQTVKNDRSLGKNWQNSQVR